MERTYKCERCGNIITLYAAGRPPHLCKSCRPIVYAERYKIKGYKYLNYRELALLSKDHACEKCGDPADIIHVHHKDRNRRNNSILNLQILCNHCHQRTHLVDNPRIKHLVFPDKIQIKTMRDEGFTFKEIGSSLNLSKQRIQQIYATMG